ncbi:C1 family peptidase [Armatimonas sp.]|uniref:C1 family peptidase n=1 Tax=Armatimonas sp. TaxID=1872638 RepID=UPI00286D28D9|nr:C1 family peptidase [Armatimonas sp.]
MQTSLNDEVLQKCRATLAADPVARIARNAVAKTAIKAVALNRDAVTRLTHTYSHTVKTGKTTSQNSSGRCWMFAGLNLFRTQIAETLGVEDFELSQNYLMFWDKLEKANYFLENILVTLDEPVGSRLLDWLCASPLQDGGQWDMFAALVKKYGVVPKEAMPETESSSRSADMNALMTLKLRQAASELRAAHAAGASEAELRAQKDALLPALYRMLVTHLGEPPTEFLWQWRDKDKHFHRDGVLTPQEFLKKYVTTELDELVCLIHCPQATKSYNTPYTIAYLGNVVGGQPIQYLNVEMLALKAATQAMIQEGKPVWFGCDVGKQMDRDLGLMDLELFEYEPLYGTSLGMDKAARLDYGQSLMTHAMVLTGVDVDENNQPRKWRVENSWGDKGGDQGFMAMTDSWFDEYLYEVVVEKQYLSKTLLALLNKPLVPLDPWDPMGSLAASV